MGGEKKASHREREREGGGVVGESGKEEPAQQRQTRAGQVIQVADLRYLSVYLAPPSVFLIVGARRGKGRGHDGFIAPRHRHR